MEKVNHLLSSIDEKLAIKEIIPLVKSLQRKFNPESEATLENITKLCYRLYMYDGTEFCLSLFEYIPDEFEDAYLNSYLRNIRALISRILREKNRVAESEALIEKIRASYTRPRPLVRFLNGDLLYDDKIAMHIRNGNEERADAWRFSQFENLCLMRELGGSEIYPEARLESEIAEIKSILQTRKTPVKKSNAALADKDNSIENLWKRIERCLQSEESGLVAQLQEGAPIEEIKQLNILIGAKLPDDFIRIYQIHNGQMPNTKGVVDNEELLSIKRIEEEWKIWKGLIDKNEFEGLFSAPEKGVRNDWYNALWIPITSDGAGNHLCLDLNPTEEGCCGQIIRVWHDDARREVVADSLQVWFTFFAEDLEAVDDE